MRVDGYLEAREMKLESIGNAFDIKNAIMFEPK